MRLTFFVTALCAPSALSFPWLAPEGMDALLDHPEARAEIDRRLQEWQAGRVQEKKQPEARAIKTGIVGGVVSLLGGTVEAVVDNVLGLIPTNKAVKGLQKFPEASHPFKAPGSTDQRGPCPGLNTLANHGCKLMEIQAATQEAYKAQTFLETALPPSVRSKRVLQRYSTWARTYLRFSLLAVRSTEAISFLKR